MIGDLPKCNSCRRTIFVCVVVDPGNGAKPYRLCSRCVGEGERKERG